jgi:8-oxo-dGTP diphosphatase
MSRREYPDRPIVGIGAVVVHEGRVLLVRRGAAPSRGLWAVPGGSLELGETLQQGAEREILEETGVTIRARDPIYAFDFFERDGDGRIRFHFVIVDLAADYIRGNAKGADDALEARWLAPEDLAGLPVSKNTLKLLRAVGFIKNRDTIPLQEVLP